MPLSPTIVWYPSGSLRMNSTAKASSQAASTSFFFSSAGASSHCEPLRPLHTFSKIVSLNRNGSCCTSPICARHHLRSKTSILCCPTNMEPEFWMTGPASASRASCSSSAAVFSPLSLAFLASFFAFCSALRSSFVFIMGLSSFCSATRE